MSGYPVLITDTAGIRISTDYIEREGIELAKQRFQSSDVKICMLDVSAPIQIDNSILQLIDSNTIILLNKQDKVQQKEKIENEWKNYFKEKGIRQYYSISCSSGEGFQQLLEGLEKEVKNK